MSLKKKLAVTTLAASMTAASFAGFPFSTEGLAKHLGVSVASAATSNEILTTLKARATALYNTLDVTDKKVLQDFRTALQGLTYPQLEEAFAPVVDQLDFLTTDDKELLYDLYVEVVNSYYTPDYSAITDIQQSPNYQAYKDLLKKIGTEVGLPDLTVEQVYNAAYDAEQAIIPLLKGINQASLIVDLQNKDSAIFKQVKEAVLKVKVGSSTVQNVVNGLNDFGITLDDLLAVKDNFPKSVADKGKAAALVVVGAYYDLYLKADGGSNPSTGNGGVTVITTPALDATTGVYDVSKLVSISGDKATLKLVDADVLKAFDSLLAANTGKTGLTFTLNLGTVDAKNVEVPLSKAIIDAAKAKGIANIALTFNGLTIAIPIAQFGDAVTFTAATLDNTAVTSVSTQKLASKVYNFELTVGGVKTTVFKQPLTIKLPLADTTGLDKELLSVAKVVYGALEFHGGVVDGNVIVENRETFSSYAVVENKVSFTDTASVQAWAGRQIQVVAAKGAIEGVGAGKFAPKNNVTRAEFAKMLVRGLNLENSTATENFSDVSATAWYASYVAVAAEKGIITGRSATQFDPNASITRAEMATMIARAVKSLNPAATSNTASLSKFTDASKIAASLKDGVAFAASNNLVIGNAGKFNPNDTANRAEAAVIIYRTINFK
ncbi:S-layer homology domain-containing protein [Paenibacillus tengchongensis]|uniref:S-layer homology domain-containing protein n=1 Tax=Paenibacillus tengchongensis TaxID=2608684 RepID=UPI00124D3B87|nr:S-layer homology domain-containing protein [Paenibacillus tengchongensis]